VTSILINKSSEGGKFFWNIGAKVGLGSPNRPADAQLVQFGYFCMLRDPRNASKLSVDEKDAFAKVSLGAACSGREDDVLVRAIRAHEASRGGTQDGFVSELGQGHIQYSGAGGKHLMILVALNSCMRQIMGGIYPRVDQHPECPGALKSLAQGFFT
jgi:hypothetical protein